MFDNLGIPIFDRISVGDNAHIVPPNNQDLYILDGLI